MIILERRPHFIGSLRKESPILLIKFWFGGCSKLYWRLTGVAAENLFSSSMSILAVALKPSFENLLKIQKSSIATEILLESGPFSRKP